MESSAVEQPAKAAPDNALPRAAQQGALVPPTTIWENEWVWVGIGIVTLGMVIVGFLMSRRSRPASRISLITSSYDRTDKP
jgi:bacteriorhodopsin